MRILFLGLMIAFLTGCSVDVVSSYHNRTSHSSFYIRYDNDYRNHVYYHYYGWTHYHYHSPYFYVKH